MFKSIFRTLRALRSHISGNATLLMAIGMPALVGAAGLAVDVTQWYAWKRELQLATDQAAIAGAWARTDSATASTYITRATQDYNANLAVVAGFASTPTVQLANYANGNANSVAVTATASKSLPFSSIVSGQVATIKAYSQASFAAGADYSACLIATRDTGTGLSVGGNATVKAKCGLAALSCSTDAITISSNATVITDSIATCGTVDAPSSLDSVITENLGAGVLTDAYAALTPPTNNTARTYACTTGQTKKATPLAGTYTGGLKVACATTLGKGIYVINGGELDLTANYAVTGTNVMFVLKNGATLKLGGSGNGNKVTLTPMQSADFTALNYSLTLANQYANMLIFEDRTSTPAGNHIINGNSTSLFQGVIYLPKGTAQINGTATLDSTCLQISAYKIDILGNASIDTRCPTTSAINAGSAKATVKLVV